MRSELKNRSSCFVHWLWGWSTVKLLFLNGILHQTRIWPGRRTSRVSQFGLSEMFQPTDGHFKTDWMGLDWTWAGRCGGSDLILKRRTGTLFFVITVLLFMWAVCSVSVRINVSCQLQSGAPDCETWNPDVNICALSGLIQALRGPLPAGLLSVQSHKLQPNQPVFI